MGGCGAVQPSGPQAADAAGDARPDGARDLALAIACDPGAASAHRPVLLRRGAFSAGVRPDNPAQAVLADRGGDAADHDADASGKGAQPDAAGAASFDLGSARVKVGCWVACRCILPFTSTKSYLMFFVRRFALDLLSECSCGWPLHPI